MHKFFAKPLFLAKKVIFLPECHSTNDFVLQHVNNADMIEGTVVFTDNQTKGKGQRGNLWLTEPGKNITCSILLKPTFLKPHDQFGLTQVTSLAVRDLIYEYTHNVKIKWPNDVYVGDKKIGGILIENTIKGSHLEYSVVGIGININQQGFSLQTATSLHLESGEHYEIETLLEALVVRLEYWYQKLKNRGKKELLTTYLENLYWMNEDHEFESQGEHFFGRIIGVDPFGRLVLQTAKGQNSYDIKEIAFIK